MQERLTDEGIYTNEWYTIYSNYFYTSYSMFKNSGNCLHYAISRVQEISGMPFPLFRGNAIDVANLTFLKRLEQPSFGALVVFGGTQYGHIAVVEHINDDGSILISQSSWQQFMFNTQVLYRENNYSCNGMPIIGFYMFDGVEKAVAEEEERLRLEQARIKEERIERAKTFILESVEGTGYEAILSNMMGTTDSLLLTGCISIQCYKGIGKKFIPKLSGICTKLRRFFR